MGSNYIKTIGWLFHISTIQFLKGSFSIMIVTATDAFCEFT